MDCWIPGVDGNRESTAAAPYETVGRRHRQSHGAATPPTGGASDWTNRHDWTTAVAVLLHAEEDIIPLPIVVLVHQPDNITCSTVPDTGSEPPGTVLLRPAEGAVLLVVVHFLPGPSEGLPTAIAGVPQHSSRQYCQTPSPRPSFGPRTSQRRRYDNNHQYPAGTSGPVVGDLPTT